MYGEGNFKINVNTNPDQFEDYVNSLPNEDFVIEIGGNTNNFYGTKSLLDNHFMFSDLFENDSSALFLTQHDLNIVYIDKKTGSVYACISGDESHLISNDLLSFLEAINLIQKVIISKYNLNPKNNWGGYKTGFIEEIKELFISGKVIVDVNYFIEFFYD